MQSNNYEQKVSVSHFDAQGNILVISASNGVVSTFIWGYNGLYPIAKVVGASRTEVESVMGNLNQPLSMDLSQSQKQTLRNNLTHAIITYYKHLPGVGLDSQTDHNGLRFRYEYDQYNRLKEVYFLVEVDESGNFMTPPTNLENLLQSFQYFYSNSN